MIYGPYDAVKVWSTKRFELIEKRAALAKDPGHEMHSERFLDSTIFPAMKKLGYTSVENKDICFVRTRANGGASINDCTRNGKTRGFDHVDKKALIEGIVDKNCSMTLIDERENKWKSWNQAIIC